MQFDYIDPRVIDMAMNQNGAYQADDGSISNRFDIIEKIGDQITITRVGPEGEATTLIKTACGKLIPAYLAPKMIATTWSGRWAYVKNIRRCASGDCLRSVVIIGDTDCHHALDESGKAIYICNECFPTWDRKRRRKEMFTGIMRGFFGGRDLGKK